MSGFQHAKILLGNYAHLGKDALHIYVGLGLFLGSALLFRWPLRSWRPWLVALAGAFAGEIWDLFDILHEGRRLQWHSQAKDILNTIFWPTMLMLLARWTKVLSRR
jgi:hypothetical protein